MNNPIITTVRICDYENQKTTGFWFSELDTVRMIFSNDFQIGTTFRIGNDEITIKSLSIDGFYNKISRDDHDDSYEAQSNCTIWIYCETKSEDFWQRITQENILESL